MTMILLNSTTPLEKFPRCSVFPNLLIRFWEAEFDLLKPHKNSKGDRRFTQQNIEQFKTIYHLVKERGFTLDGAKKEIKNNKDHVVKKMQTISTLSNVKGLLEEMLQEEE